MRSFHKLVVCLASLALWTGAPMHAKDDTVPAKASDKAKEADKKKADKKKDDKKKDARKKPDDGNPEAANGGKLSLPLVKDHDSFGLKIPYYDEKGNLQMIYTIGVATRIDDDNVRMKEVKVETYNTEGEPDMTVELPISMLNLTTKVVTSKTKTTITREDFVLTGDSVEFNTVTKQAKLVGHVHMTVYNLNDEEAKPPTPAAAEGAGKPNE